MMTLGISIVLIRYRPYTARKSPDDLKVSFFYYFRLLRHKHSQNSILAVTLFVGRFAESLCSVRVRVKSVCQMHLRDCYISRLNKISFFYSSCHSADVPENLTVEMGGEVRLIHHLACHNCFSRNMVDGGRLNP
jgi:hypothetical protein